MPELLRLRTLQFEFSVWSNDIERRQQVYKRTLEKRAPSFSQATFHSRSHVRFSPPVVILDQFVLGQIENLEAHPDPNKIEELPLNESLFFENTQYQFEWIFFLPTKYARLTHRSKRINDAFRFVPERAGLPARLTGNISTGNDVGWLLLPLEFEENGQTNRSNISLEILPTKMILHQDLSAMYQVIDQTFPLWRFSLVEKTEQDAAKGMQRGHFPLMWLANFSQLHERLELGLKVIAQAPHSRLQPQVFFNKAARLKGRIPHKLEARINEDFATRQYNKRYQVRKKQLSVDTPENRFIKMVITQSKKQLEIFERGLRKNNEAPENQRLSDAFLNELHSWQEPLRKLTNQSFFKEVGGYTSSNRESLVLQQKTGYSLVYRVWQELKFYLDIFSNQSSVSMKSVAEIYEIWCFLCIKRILETELDFILETSNKVTLTLNDFFEYQLKDGFVGAFEFTRDDGVKAKLAHEPRFSKQGKNIRSYLVTQKPDIVLEVTLPKTNRKNSGKKFIWIFDAKYQIKKDSGGFDADNNETTDYVPDEAINQMHRYRDALIHLSQSAGPQEKDSESLVSQKSRPVFGAFALYPGFFDQRSEKNPYSDAIEEIGIGAFPLLPNSCDTWLTNFLREQIGASLQYPIEAMAENLYVKEAARIPHYGMSQKLYSDLTMTIALGRRENREDAYFEKFKQNSAQWYHLPQNLFLTKYGRHIASEIRYLAIADVGDDRSAHVQISRVWPIKHVSLVTRAEMTTEQTGRSSKSNESYYLFELGRPLLLSAMIQGVPNHPFDASIKLTQLKHLVNAKVFNELPSVYEEILARGNSN
ncbi:MAG: restriction endonuclease-like protein [Idiomarina sp.]|nr:restriction endonuclease-like protein [Idiomarina sp.]